jgi:hypothetical protein
VTLERSIPLTSQTLVREAWLNRGDLSFQIVNNADLSMTLRFRLPELLGPTGQVYEQVLTLSARDSRNVAVNLARHRITSSGGGFLRALRAECTVDALAGGAGDTITVHATDFVSVGVTSGLIVADSIVAALQPTLIAVDETVGLNLSSISDRFRGSLEIPAGDLRFTPRTSVNVPAELNLTLQGRDAGGRVVSLAMPAQKATAQLSAVDFAAADVGNFLTQFAGRLPDSLRVVGTLLLNPDYDTTSATAIGRNCSFAGDVDLAVPLRLRIAGGSFADTLVLGDTTADGRSDKRLDDDLLNGTQTARIVVEIDNGLPLAVALRVDLLDRSRNRVLTLPQTAGDSVLVAPGVVINGDVQSSTRTVRILEISGSELRQFNVADLVRLSLGLSTPGTTYVNFRATDRVRVRVWTQSCYRVNA